MSEREREVSSGIQVRRTKTTDHGKGRIQRFPVSKFHNGRVSLDSSRFEKDLSFGERSVSYAGPSVWNRLPQTLRHSDSASSFKAALKTHLFNNYFSTVFHNRAYNPSSDGESACVRVCVSVCLSVCR